MYQQGGSVSAGTTLVTQKAFENNDETTNPTEKGKFTIDTNASVMFVDEIGTQEVDGEIQELSILVKSGVHAKVNVFKNMRLTNSGLKRSAIDIEPGGTLDLWVAEGAEVTVNSGFGEDADVNTPGKGGYAGIHVPEGAVLNLKGTGTITAIGGNSGNGGTTNEESDVVAGGGGAGAGIGGNGGNGGAGKSNRGNSGGSGEKCGEVKIYNSLRVYAYGGAGGSGGADGIKSNGAQITGTGGGGGYPAAGIGGGRSWWCRIYLLCWCRRIYWWSG